MIKQFLIVLIMLVSLSCGRNEPLSTYEPKSPQEAALKSLLLKFENYVNTRNAEMVASLIHEDASIMLGRERKILSKSEYRKILPQRLANNPSIALSQPKIKVSGNKAEVKVYLARGNFGVLLVYNMVQENNQWYIESWKY